MKERFMVALVAIALVFCAPVLPPALGEGGSYQDPAAVEDAKALIAALPADPDTIDESYRAQIEEAAAAYDALPAADRAALDSEVLDKEQSYGRWLESAQWGLAAATEVLDDATDLADGDYSAYAESVSSMGKSTSERARSWSITSLTAKTGKLVAVISCDQASAFKNLRLAGTDYEATSVDGVPQFTVPMQANTDLKFTVDASEIADSIAYEIEAQIDLSQASTTEVAYAKKLATKALSSVKPSWTPASRKAVRAAADSLASVAAKDGVKRVELELFQAELSAAQKAVKVKKSEGSATGAGTAKKGSGEASSGTGASGSGSGASSHSSSVSGASASSVPSASSSAGSSSSTSSAKTGGSSKAAPTKGGKKAKTEVVELGASGSSDVASSGASSSAASAQPSAGPNYPLLLALAIVLLLLFGMVLRSVTFNRMMGSGKAMRRGGDSRQ